MGTSNENSAYLRGASPSRRRLPMCAPHLWKTVLVIALILSAASASAQTPTPVKPMAADAHPSFAVATIKPHDPNSNRQGFNATGDRYTVRNQTIVSLMMFAYSIDHTSSRRTRVGQHRPLRHRRDDRHSRRAQSAPATGDVAEATRRSLRAQVPSRDARATGLCHRDCKGRPQAQTRRQPRRRT